MLERTGHADVMEEDSKGREEPKSVQCLGAPGADRFGRNTELYSM